MSALPPSESPTPAEQRLLALLLLLRSPSDGANPSLIGSVMRRVRIQMMVRELLGVLGGVTRAAEEVLRLLARGSRKEQS